MKKLFLAILTIFVCNTSFAVVDDALVGRAEKYLNGISGLAGDFVQVSGS